MFGTSHVGGQAGDGSKGPISIRRMITFAVEAGERFVPRLFAELDVPIRQVSVARPSLDDVFMEYTGSTIRDAEASSLDQLRTTARAMGR